MGILKPEDLEAMTLPLDDETMNAIINEGEKVRLPDIPPGQTEANRKIRKLHRQVNLLQDSIEILEHRKKHLSVYLKTLQMVFNLHSQKNPHLASQAYSYGEATAKLDSMPLLQNIFDDEIAILEAGGDEEDIPGSQPEGIITQPVRMLKRQKIETA